MKLISLVCITTAYFILGQCSSQKSSTQQEPNLVKLPDVPYNIHQLDHVLVLPSELVEVSGLAYNIKNESLMAVNDELGYIYELDTEEGRIQSKLKFADIGDYEGIEFMNEDLVVTRSNGKLYFYNLETDNTYKIIRTDVSTRNNIEGITFDKKGNRLLLACKGVPHVPGVVEDTKGKLICSYSLNDDNLMHETYILIKDKQLKKKVSSIYADVGLTEKQLKSLKDRVEGFAPSGLAFHPISGDLYILSAQKSLLVVVDAQKEIKHIHFLEQDIHVQPEGICFTPDGDMYISNEGKNRSAKIYLYTYQN